MPTKPLMQLPKIKSEAEFESICTDILTGHYKRTFSRYGRKGQKQYGIDIYCDIENKKKIVAQCKNYLSSKPNNFDTQIENDIKSATAKFNIDTFVIMTALDRDTRIQDFVTELNGKYQFSIELWFWEDIQEKILSDIDLLVKHYPSFVISNIIEKLQLGFKSKTTVESEEEIKSKERLGNVLRILELACESDIEADDAQRMVKKFISSFNELGDIVKKDSLAEITEKCFDIAIQVEVSHDLDFTAHQKYLEWLYARNNTSRAIDIQEQIIKKLEKDNPSDWFKIAKDYGKLADKCLYVPQCTIKGFAIIEKTLDYWINIIRSSLSDEETLELAGFMCTLAKFFDFEAQPYMNSEESRISEGRPDFACMGRIQLQVYHVVERMIKRDKYFINFDEVGFPIMYKTLNCSSAFQTLIQLIRGKIEDESGTYIYYTFDNASFCAEFYALTSFSLIAGLIAKDVQVPLGYIAVPINTLTIILSRGKRTANEKDLHLEAIRYIENLKNSEEQCLRLSLAYKNYGVWASRNNDFATTERYYRLSLDEVKKRSNEYNKPINKTLALAHMSLANLYAYAGKNSDSIQQYEKAKAVFELLEKSGTDPETYNIDYVRCLKDLAEQYRISWFNENQETGSFTTKYAGKSMAGLSKARSICVEQYESAIDTYGPLFIDVDIEFAHNLAWLEPVLDKTANKSEDLVKDAIMICKDMISRKSEAYYPPFRRVIEYLQTYISICPELAQEQETVERIFKQATECFVDVIDFIECGIKNGEIDPKFLYPSWVYMRTDFALLSDRGFFEWLNEFETVYFMCVSNLCSVYIQQGEVDKVKEQCQKAKVFAEYLKNNVSVFLYEEEIRKIEKLEADLILQRESKLS